MESESTVDGVPEKFYEAWWEKVTKRKKRSKLYLTNLADGNENYNLYKDAIVDYYGSIDLSEEGGGPVAPNTEQYKHLRLSSNNDKNYSVIRKIRPDAPTDPGQSKSLYLREPTLIPPKTFEEKIPNKIKAVENKKNVEELKEEIEKTEKELRREIVSNNSKSVEVRTQVISKDDEELTPKKAPSLDERETEKFTNPKSSNKNTVLLLAVLLSFILALSLIKIGGFEILGIALISTALGFNLVSLLWLEILSSERFKFRADLSWSFGFWSITIIPSIIATISILWSTSIPGVLDYNYQYIFTEDIGASKESYLNQILVFQIMSNTLLLLSMIKTKSLSPRLIKSPWSISSLVSLIVFCVIIAPGKSIIYSDLLLLIFCFIIIGSSSWIYGRRDEGNYFQMSIIFLLPSSLGFYMIVEEVFPVNEEFAILSYLVLPIILNAITLLLPNKSDNINTNKKGINAVGFIILSIALINIILISTITEGWNELIPMMSMLGFVSYRREHSRKIGGDFVIIHRILSRELGDDNARREYKKANLKITLLGASGTGKTSYCAALWTLITSRINREIWWTKDIEILGKHEYLNEVGNKETLEALAEQGGCTGKDKIGEMLGERVAGMTCKKWIERGDLPEPSNNSPIPFSAEAFGKSEEELQRLKNKITAKDPSVRGLPDPTQKGGKIEMDISFLAEVEQITPRFLLSNRESVEGRKGAITEVTLRLESWDITGESFEDAVEYTRLQLSRGIKTSQLKTKNIKQQDLGEIESSVGLDEINRAKHLFINSPQIFYIVDVDDLVNKGDMKNVEKFLRLITKLNIGGGLGLESIKILINKADELIDNTTNDQLRLSKWEELRNSSKADNLVNRMTNQALDDLRATGLQVSSTFICSFGGLVPELDENGKARFDDNNKPLKQASYPMVPVNVLEPLIDLLLSENSRLYCEEN